MEKGVILIAINCDSYKKGKLSFYGKLAYNMANSIKKHSNTHITVLTDDNCLDGINKSVFDNVIKVDIKEYFDQGVINPLKLKPKIYDYSPYDRTIYLDVDGLNISKERSLDSLFDLLKDSEFEIQEVGRYKKQDYAKCHMVWVSKVGKDIRDIYNAYNIPDENLYPEYNSSFIYFKKNQVNLKFFKQVRDNYIDRRLEWKDMGGRYPDELAFNLASTQLKHYNTIEGFKPIFFQWENDSDRLKGVKPISEKHWFLGMAGGYHFPRLRRLYDSITKAQGSPYHKKCFQSRDKMFHMR